MKNMFVAIVAIIALPLGVLALDRPTIVSSTEGDFILQVGDSVTFSVQAEGEGLFYQWYYHAPEGVPGPIEGATASELHLSDLTVKNTGFYWAVVGNTAGTARSGNVRLAVHEEDLSLPPAPDWIGPATAGWVLNQDWTEFGFYWFHGPWVYSLQIGEWLYSSGETAESVYFWSHDWGWFWTSNSLYPLAYLFNSGEWVDLRDQ